MISDGTMRMSRKFEANPQDWIEIVCECLISQLVTVVRISATRNLIIVVRRYQEGR